jgi:aminocarboxymuconate-semialdehyde decarboxylase
MSQSPRQRKSAAGGGKAPARRRVRKLFVIDMHSHFSDEVVTEFLASRAPGGGFSDKLGISKKLAAAQMRNFAFVNKRNRDPKLRLKEMDELGIDFQILSSNASAGCYWADGVTGLEMSRRNNNSIAELVATYPNRFAGIGAVPLQDVNLAVQELNRMINDLGLRGVIIGSHVGGTDLGERRFWRFWAALEKLGVPALVHPNGFTQPERLNKYYMWNTVGQPLEEALFMSSLIYEGVMDKFPKLKVLICHGGGYLPFYAGRADQGYRTRPEMRGKAKREPSKYMPRFYYDTVFYNRDMLEFLVKKVGDTKIMMGTDYPHFIGEWNPLGFVRKTPGLSKETKDKILWKNAAKLFRIQV